VGPASAQAMPKTKTLLFYASLLLAVSPALLLLWPALAGGWAADAAAQDPWLLGLEIGWLIWAVLAWRLNQNRLTLLAPALAAAAAWLVGQSQAGLARGASEAWLLCLPSGLALSLLPPEGALLSERSFGRLVLAFLPAGLAWAVFSADAVEARQLMDWRAAGAPGAGLSHLAHVGLLLLIPALWWRWHAKVEAVLLALSGGLLGQALLAWAIQAAGPPPTAAARVWLASQALFGLAMAVGLFLLYWQRVYLDELTAIPNRRALDEAMTHLSGPWAMAMVDIDHFKKFNDSYGHDQGDDVLRLVARHLAESTNGRAYRYGGEEFCVLCPGLDTEAVESLMEGARAGLAKRRFHIRLPKGIRKKTGPPDRGSLTAPTTQVQVTISVGVSRPDKRHPDPAQVMKMADEGLYKAKESGRNKVIRAN
jgi:diguanylate cyclase (GGDEF)-like protein